MKPALSTLIVFLMFCYSIQKNYLKHKKLAEKGSALAKKESWHKMVLEMDKSVLEELKDDPLLGRKAKLNIRMLESVQRFINNFFKVASLPKLRFSSTLRCNGIPVPTQVNAHYYIKVRLVEEASRTLASARICLTSTSDRRPVGGIITINKSVIWRDNVYEKMIYSVMLHETIHLLGFHNFFFSFFDQKRKDSGEEVQPLLGSVSIRGNQYDAIVLDSIVEEARKYYGCESMKGIPLNTSYQSGKIGSHWYEPAMLDAILDQQGGNPEYLSPWTLALLESYGWYQIDKKAAEPFIVGKNWGCNYMEKCPFTENNCSEYETRCSESFMFRRYYGTRFRSRSRDLDKDSCIYGETKSDMNIHLERIGPESSCLLTKKSGKAWTGCYKTKCFGSFIKIYLADGDVVECLQENQEIKVRDSISIICPDITKFCRAEEHRCFNDCSGNGTCLFDKICFCYQGFNGIDCSNSIFTGENIGSEIEEKEKEPKIEVNTTSDYEKEDKSSFWLRDSLPKLILGCCFFMLLVGVILILILVVYWFIFKPKFNFLNSAKSKGKIYKMPHKSSRSLTKIEPSRPPRVLVATRDLDELKDEDVDLKIK